MNDLENRIGKLTISKDLLLENPEGMMLIMSKLIIIRCEYFYHLDSFEYIALSYEFDIIDKGTVPPRYKVWVTTDVEPNTVEFKSEYVD